MSSKIPKRTQPDTHSRDLHADTRQSHWRIRKSAVERISKLCLCIAFGAFLATTAMFAQGPRRQNVYDFPAGSHAGFEISTNGQDLDRYIDPDHNTMNGYVLTGYNHYYNPSTQAAYDKANLTRLTSCGDIYWSRDLEALTPGHESRGASVRQTSDGGFILTGSIKTPTSANWDILLMKLDQYGSVQWEQRFAGFFGEDHGTAVREVYNPSTSSYDGFILTGAIDIYTDNGVCDDPSSRFENATLVVIRTDVNGTMLWNQTIKPNVFGCIPPMTIPDYNHYSYGYDLEQVVDGNGNLTNQFVVTGTFAQATYYSSGACPGIPCQVNPKRALLTSITDNAGAGSVLNWLNIYSIPVRNNFAGNTTGYSVKQTSTGFAVAGTSDFTGTPTLDQDIYLLETDPMGMYLTSRTYDANATERGASLEVTDDAYYIFGSHGVFSSISGFSWDGLITKIDRTTGNATWTERYGGAGFDILSSSYPESGEHYSVIGTSGSYTPTFGYYFLNNVGENIYGGCEECSIAEELTAHPIDQDFPFYDFLHSQVFQYPEDDAWILRFPEETIECECPACPDVDITFQHGYGIFADRGHSVKEARDDGFILAGFTGDDDLTNADIFLYKASDDGSGQWNAAIYEATNSGSVYDERGFSVVLPGFGYAVAGDALSGTDMSAYLVKTSNNGTPQWSMIFGRQTTGSEYEEAFRSLRTTDDNNSGTLDHSDGYIAAGFSDQLFQLPARLHNGYIAKVAVNNMGMNPSQTWGYIYGHDQDDFYMDIIQVDEDQDGIADDGYLAAGFSNSTFDPEGDKDPQLTGYNVFVTKVDESGNEEWSYIYGTENDDVAYAVVQTDDDFDGQADDGFIVVGATGTIALTSTYEIDDVNSSTDFYVLKIASDGSLEWSYTIDQEDHANAYSVVQADDYSFVVGGDAVISSQNMQTVLFKISPCGDEIEWAHHYPDDPSTPYSEDHARELIKKSDGGYALFGSTCTYQGNGGGSAAKGDFYLVKTDCMGDVCFSGTLNLTLDNPGTVYKLVEPTVNYGPDDMIGDPRLNRPGIDYIICPEEEESTSPSPGESIDLSWILRRH